MNKKKKLAKINKKASIEIFELKAVLDALFDINQAHYPANVMIEIAKKKVRKIFNNIETTRKVLKNFNHADDLHGKY
ncbi:MAG: hypothetical protein PHV68_01870 [Candidatus Gastranaerophilales bacterium]|nr:hypothetical protein [Candidatus Gastranaerophilales bacterium]